MNIQQMELLYKEISTASSQIAQPNSVQLTKQFMEIIHPLLKIKTKQEYFITYTRVLSLSEMIYNVPIPSALEQELLDMMIATIERKN